MNEIKSVIKKFDIQITCTMHVLGTSSTDINKIKEAFNNREGIYYPDSALKQVTDTLKDNDAFIAGYKINDIK